MTKPVCPYTRSIEPLRDGLLSAAEREALEEHLGEGCDTCQAEVRYLDWLAGELRRSTPTIDEVSVQRRRLPLLMQAEQQRQRWYTQGQQRLGAVKGALAAVALIGLGFLLVDRSPRVSVERMAGQGEVRRFTEGERSVVQLSDGRYQLQVKRGVLDRSLVVRLPDGEIEDLGTSFGVTVSEGRTSRVVVSEGAVQLRLQGSPSVTLDAGGVWELHRQAPEAAASVVDHADHADHADPQAQTAAGAAQAAALAPQPANDRELKAPAAVRGKASKRALPTQAATATTAGAVNTEDAMYLRILDLLREDRNDAARSLAERYLKEFPEGFRRAEVLRIASPQD